MLFLSACLGARRKPNADTTVNNDGCDVFIGAVRSFSATSIIQLDEIKRNLTRSRILLSDDAPEASMDAAAAATFTKCHSGARRNNTVFANVTCLWPIIKTRIRLIPSDNDDGRTIFKRYFQLTRRGAIQIGG